MKGVELWESYSKAFAYPTIMTVVALYVRNVILHVHGKALQKGIDIQSLTPHIHQISATTSPQQTVREEVNIHRQKTP